MSTSLNLTLKRGPSVWDHPRRSPSSYWRVYGVAASAVLATLATARRDNRQLLFGLALGIAGTCLLAGRFSSTLNASARQLRVRRGAHNDPIVDRASEDSFPASDPPQY